MSKFDINEAFIKALQEQEQEDAKSTVLKLSDKMKEIPVKKGSITATPSIERTMRAARDRKGKKDELLDISVNTGDISSNLDLGGLGALTGLLASEETEKCDDKLEEKVDSQSVVNKLKSADTINYEDIQNEIVLDNIEMSDDDVDALYTQVKDELVKLGFKDTGTCLIRENGELKEALDSPKDSYWEGRGKYQDLTKLINDKLLPAEGTDAKVSGIIPENLFKQYVILQNKYYRFYNDGELPFRKTSAGWNATKSGLDRDFKNQFNDDIDKPVLAQVGTDLENKMNSLIEKILKAVPDLEEKLNNIGKESKNEEVEYISKKELDDMPDDYKTTVKDTIDTEVNYHGKDRAKVTKMYKDLGYDEDDPMILASEKGGTVLKPVKVKEESKLNEDIEIVDSEQGTETITDLHTDLFRLVNMYQYGIGDDVVCSREQLDEVMRNHAEPIISDAFKYALPSAEVEFTRFEHPEYYRAFTNLNDQLFFNVTFDKSEYERLKEETLNDDYFFEYLKDNYSSYDGFISYMATDRDEFNNQEDWRQFVQVVQYNMPEFTEEQYNQFLYDVEEELYSEYDTDRAIIEYAEENMPSDTENFEQWVRDNFNIPEDFDIDYIVDEIKDIVKDTTSDVDETEMKEESKEVKTEDLIDMGDLRDSIDTADLIEDEDEEDDYGETISLLGIAYRDIPEVGVEEWGKDDELNFYIDTRKVLADLEMYEIEIPKKMYENASPDDWSNGVDEYIETILGLDPTEFKSDNTYNWGSRLTHDLNIDTYKTEDAFYVKMSVHRSGDVRGNYTVDFLLGFDSEDDYYEALLESQAENSKFVEVDNKTYRIEPDIFSEHCNIWCEEDQKSWDEVVCESIEELKEIVANQEGLEY